MSDSVILWQSVEQEQYLRNRGADFRISSFKENTVVLNNFMNITSIISMGVQGGKTPGSFGNLHVEFA